MKYFCLVSTSPRRRPCPTTVEADDEFAAAFAAAGWRHGSRPYVHRRGSSLVVTDGFNSTKVSVTITER